MESKLKLLKLNNSNKNHWNIKKNQYTLTIQNRTVWTCLLVSGVVYGLWTLWWLTNCCGFVFDLNSSRQYLHATQ